MFSRPVTEFSSLNDGIVVSMHRRYIDTTTHGCSEPGDLDNSTNTPMFRHTITLSCSTTRWVMASIFSVTEFERQQHQYGRRVDAPSHDDT
jgi:hypothetical protein